MLTFCFRLQEVQEEVDRRGQRLLQVREVCGEQPGVQLVLCHPGQRGRPLRQPLAHPLQRVGRSCESLSFSHLPFKFTLFFFYFDDVIGIH